MPTINDSVYVMHGVNIPSSSQSNTGKWKHRSGTGVASSVQRVAHGLEGPDFAFQSVEFFSHPETSRPSLVPIQRPLQWAPVFIPVGKANGPLTSI
jgi:hypothetical protein